MKATTKSKKNITAAIWLVLLLLSTQRLAASGSTGANVGNRPPGKVSPVEGIMNSSFLDKIVVAGYLRSHYYNRGMSLPYDQNGEQIGRYKTSGMWDGYYDPFLFMYVGGDPTKDNSFGTEIVMLNMMNGPGFNENILQVFNAMAVRGNISTSLGQFSIITGGIEWRSLSKFTFGQNVRYNRYSLFERRPWDPVGNIKTRYASYYSIGTLDQSVRFSNRAFKGFMVHGTDLPHDLTLDLFYGKSLNNGGILPEDHLRPAYNFAGKVNKAFGPNHNVSLNTYISRARTDTVNAELARFQMLTMEYDLKVKGFRLLGEIGYGGYESPEYVLDQDPAAVLEVQMPEKLTKFPVSLRGYWIGKNFVNRNAAFSNSTIDEVNTGFMGQGAAVLAPNYNQMAQVGDLMNNRTGVNLNTELRFGALKIQLGNEIGQDIENLPGRNKVVYNHRINALTWSRFKPFPNEGPAFGPNNRVNTFYRGAYEVVTVDSAYEDSIKGLHFNALDLQFKWRQKLFGRDLFVFNTNSWGSFQSKASLLPVFNSEALIRSSYHEIDVYYQLTRDLIIDLYGGIERIVGNEMTDVELQEDGSLAARDQISKSIGIGLDIALSQKAYLFLRHRLFSYEDKNFDGEAFKGHEFTVELKMFF